MTVLQPINVLAYTLPKYSVVQAPSSEKKTTTISIYLDSHYVINIYIIYQEELESSILTKICYYFI